MIRKNMQLIGVGIVALGLSLPFAAQAHQDDQAMAFVVGAAVGYAIGDDRDRHRHVQYRSPRHGKHYRERHWRRHAAARAKAHKRWRRAHYSHHRDSYAYTPHDRRYRDRGRYVRDGYRDRTPGQGYSGHRRPRKG